MSLLASRIALPIAAGLVAISATLSGANGLGGAIATAVVDELVENAIVLGLGFAAPNGGGPLTGLSTVTNLDADRLAVQLRAALVDEASARDLDDAGAPFQPTTDFANAVAAAIIDEISTNAIVNATGLAAVGAAVTGSASLSGLNAARLAILLNTALLDMGAAPGTSTATLALVLAGAIVLELSTNAAVPGTGLIAPGAGGPCSGASTIT